MSDDAAWDPFYNGVIGHVSDDTCADADDYVASDSETWGNPCADTDNGVVAYLAIAAHACSGGDVTSVADAGVMGYHRAVIDDAAVPDPHFGVDDRPGLNQISLADAC